EGDAASVARAWFCAMRDGRLTTVRHWAMFLSDSYRVPGRILPSLNVARRQASSQECPVDLNSWMAARFRRGPRSAGPGRLPSGRCRPTLELLENRLAPATLTVNTLADSIGGSQLSLRDAILAVDG